MPSPIDQARYLISMFIVWTPVAGAVAAQEYAQAPSKGQAPRICRGACGIGYPMLLQFAIQAVGGDGADAVQVLEPSGELRIPRSLRLGVRESCPARVLLCHDDRACVG